MDAHGKSEDCCAPKGGCGPCPTCGRPTRPVSALTLASHLPASMAAEFGDRASFCPNPGCDTVYCNSGGKTASRDQLNSPVTVKDLADAVPVCYCFGFSRGDLRRDMSARGSTAIPEEIKKGIKEGRCDCERKNPQGSCCLGNVAAEIAKIRRESAREKA